MSYKSFHIDFPDSKHCGWKVVIPGIYDVLLVQEGNSVPTRLISFTISDEEMSEKDKIMQKFDELQKLIKELK